MKTPIEIYRAIVETVAREVREQFHWARIAFDVVFAVGAFLLDKTLGESWLTFAFVTYLLAKSAIHGAIACSIRLRSGKWPRPRLHLTLINLALMIALVLVAWRFGGASNTTALVQIPLFLMAVFTAEYFSNYRRNKRVVREEFARFTNGLGIDGR